MNTETIVVRSPVEVLHRLNELGVTCHQLWEVVTAMVGARNSSTENDPPGAAGWLAWQGGTRRLREILRSQGWDLDDSNQISGVYNRTRGIRISVINTDDGTGLENRVPQNRSRKGPGTSNVINSNQGSFIDELDASLGVAAFSRAATQPGLVRHWCLCVFSDGDEVRAELSCPNRIDGGFVTSYHERVLLSRPTHLDDGVKVRRTAPVGPDADVEFDIPVRRKQAG